jgi:hypothetical protein
MHSEHDRTHGHGLRVRPRGRMPYTESRDLPSPVPGEPLVEPVEPLVRPVEPPIMPVPPVMPVEPLVRACPFGEPPWAETGGASDPSTRRSWVDIESRPFSMPPPPGRWDRPWSQISRDQLLRPALIVGFLAAAGAGIWLSGWSPSPDPPMVEAVPGPTARRSLAGHDMTVPPTSGGTPNAPSLSRAPAPPAPASGAKASAERERERRTARGRKSAASLPARTSRSLSGSGGGAHRADQGERRWEMRRAPRATGRPGAIESAKPAQAEETRTAPAANARSAPAARDRSTTAANPRTAPAARARSTPPANARSAPPANIRSAPAARARTAPAEKAGPRSSQAPVAPRTRIPAPGGAKESRVGAGGAGVSAAYACQHLDPGDWRYAYCVQVWNNYKGRNSSP